MGWRATVRIHNGWSRIPVNKGDQVLMLGLDVVSEGAAGGLVHHGQLGQVAEHHQVKEGGGVAEEELLLAKHLGQNLQVVLRQLVELLGGGLAESVALHHLEAVFAEVVLEEKLEEGEGSFGVKVGLQVDVVALQGVLKVAALPGKDGEVDVLLCKADHRVLDVLLLGVKLHGHHHLLLLGGEGGQVVVGLHGEEGGGREVVLVLNILVPAKKVSLDNAYRTTKQDISVMFCHPSLPAILTFSFAGPLLFCTILPQAPRRYFLATTDIASFVFRAPGFAYFVCEVPSVFRIS